MAPTDVTSPGPDQANKEDSDTTTHVAESQSQDNDVEKLDKKDDDPSRAGAEDDQKFPGPAQVAIIMGCILSAIFIMSLDRTIIATAIPQITDEFNSLGDIGWYGSAFTLTTCCFQLLWGRVYEFYSPKYVFLGLITLFEVGSIICGAAPNSIAFIFGRAIAGMGSAGILTGAIVLMAIAVPLHKRPFYNGFFSVVLGTSSVVGPLIGGAFTTRVTWRWCFYLNVPVGGAAMLVIILLLEAPPAEEPGLSLRQQLARLDLLGELFLFPCIICLLLALQWGGSTYSWSDGRIIVLLVFFALCLIAFVLVEIFTQKTAIIQAHVIKNRSILSAMWFMFCLASVMLTLIYYLPLWLQAIKDQTALQSGIDTLPLVISLTVASIISGQTVGRIGYYTPLTIASSCFMAIGAGLITTFRTDTGTGTWIGFQILVGFGIGLGLQHGPMAAYTVLARKDVPVGVSLVFFCQQLAGSIFISVGQNVFSTTLVTGLQGIANDIDPSQIVHAGATQLRGLVPDTEIASVRAVYNGALRWVWVVATVMACLSIIGSATLEWRSVKGKQGPTKKSESEEKGDEQKGESEEKGDEQKGESNLEKSSATQDSE